MKNLLRTILFTGIISLTLSSLAAQEKIPSGQYFAALTDRSTYVTGENIYFTSRQIDMTVYDTPCHVLYVDLLSPGGQVVKSGKYSINHRYSHGAIKIPENIQSGTYYLRFYSKWLMNFSARSMQYITVVVINPDIAAKIPPHGENDPEVISTSLEKLHKESPQDFSMELAKKKVKKRENVVFKISSAAQSDHLLNVSVFPDGSNNQSYMAPAKEFIPADQVYHMPEISGITLTGLLQDENTEEPLKNEAVFLTLFGREGGFFPTHTNSQGRFEYSLPNFSGMQEVFLTPKAKGTNIQIDTDVHTGMIKLPFVPLKIDSSENVRILTMARQHQLYRDYFDDADFLSDSAALHQMSFFGEPYKTVVIENFIDLPTLHDYFIELLPEVQIKKSGEHLRLNISGPSAENDLIEPLVLIDGLALTDVKALLDIDPKRIRKIEVVNMPWIRGDNMFGGILSLSSAKGDFAGVDLPESSSFFNYKMYHVETSFPQNNTPAEAYTPDVRNTLYWNPTLLLGKKNSKEITFKAGDLPGKYIIRVCRIDHKGKIFSAEKSFIVED